MTPYNEVARIEAALDVLVGEMVAIDTAPRALALKDGLLNDRVRTTLLDAITLLGERLRRHIAEAALIQIADDVAKGPHYHRRLGVLVAAWTEGDRRTV